MAGSQISFFGNLAQKDQKGWQISGMANWTVGALQGGQIGGAINIGNQVRGWQLSGSTNIVKRIRGLQIAGAANIAKEVRGVQLGPFNAAARVEGWQFGLINISGDIEGVPVGIFNYSHTGLFSVSGWRDELGFNYLTLLSGSRTFFTSFSVGHEMPAAAGVHALGFGVGWHHARGRSYFENSLDLYRLFAAVDAPREGNQLTRWRLLAGRELGARASIFAGFSLNLLYVEDDPLLVSPWADLTCEFGADWLLWPGLFAGVRLGR
jgi:hypothetical protein